MDIYKKLIKVQNELKAPKNQSQTEVSEIYKINYSTLKAWLQGVNKGNGRFEYIG